MACSRVKFTFTFIIIIIIGGSSSSSISSSGKRDSSSSGNPIDGSRRTISIIIMRGRY